MTEDALWLHMPLVHIADRAKTSQASVCPVCDEIAQASLVRIASIAKRKPGDYERQIEALQNARLPRNLLAVHFFNDHGPSDKGDTNQRATSRGVPIHMPSWLFAIRLMASICLCRSFPHRGTGCLGEG